MVFLFSSHSNLWFPLRFVAFSLDHFMRLTINTDIYRMTHFFLLLLLWIGKFAALLSCVNYLAAFSAGLY